MHVRLLTCDCVFILFVFHAGRIQRDTRHRELKELEKASLHPRERNAHERTRTRSLKAIICFHNLLEFETTNSTRVLRTTTESVKAESTRRIQ